jgi:O-antigen/teichoic acid export membrane protein
MDNKVISNFSKNAVYYFLGNILTKLVTFLLLPLYTRNLTPSIFGYFDLVTTVLNVGVSVFFIEIWQGFLRFLLEKDGKVDQDKILVNGMSLVLLFSLLYSACFLIFSIEVDIKSATLVFILGLLTAYMNILEYIARGIKKNLLFVASGIANSVVTILLNVYLVLIKGMGLDALLISACVSNLVSILIIIIFSNQKVNFSLKDFDWSIQKDLIKYCAPLAVNSISYWLLTSYNRIVVLNVLGIENNGLFAVASKFAYALSLFTSVFLLSWQETAFKISTEANRNKYYTKFFNSFSIFLLQSSVILLTGSLLVYPFIIGSDFALSKDILPLFFAGTIASAISNFLGHIFGAEKKTGIIFTSTVIGAIVAIITINVTINYIGLNAAALSILTGYLACLIVRFLIIQRSVKISLEKKNILFSILLFLLAAFAFFRFTFVGNLISLVFFVIIWVYFSKNLILTFMKPLLLKARTWR